MNDQTPSNPNRPRQHGEPRPDRRPPTARQRSPKRGENGVARWLPVIAAGGLLAMVIGAGVIGGRGGASDGLSASGVTATFGGTEVTRAATPVTYDPVATLETSAPIVKTTLDRTLSRGVSGEDVLAVQERLTELGFDPGPSDGHFGSLTTQSVWAFEKLVMGVPRSEASGRVSPEMWSRMQDPIQIAPRAPSGGLADHVEIYLPEQVMVVFHADVPVLVTHVATGQLNEGATGFELSDAYEYCETIRIDTDIDGNLLEEPETKPICGKAYTPPGVFEAYREIEGRRDGPLGGMQNPIYINQGIAIHGADNVPLEPASHGCIRVSQYLGAKLQGIIELGDRVLIWDGVTAPRDQSAEAMKMRWDYPDPDATTTTSTTTTTTSTTTTTIAAPAPIVTSTTTTSTAGTPTSTSMPQATTSSTSTSSTTPGTTPTTEP